ARKKAKKVVDSAASTASAATPRKTQTTTIGRSLVSASRHPGRVPPRGAPVAAEARAVSRPRPRAPVGGELPEGGLPVGGRGRLAEPGHRGAQPALRPAPLVCPLLGVGEGTHLDPRRLQ